MNTTETSPVEEFPTCGTCLEPGIEDPGAHTADTGHQATALPVYPTRAAAVDAEIIQRLLDLGYATDDAARAAVDVEAIAAQAITTTSAGYARGVVTARLWTLLTAYEKAPR